MTEFYVYFNDLLANDFNTLVTSLPPERRYCAVVIPGDCHHRVLPESSLHFAYTAWSLHWLTRVPEAVLAENKGEVLYSTTSERKEVYDAYLDQFSRDMESFLEARAVEVVGGGLVALLIPGLPEFWNPKEEYTHLSDLNLLGSCLMDMATKLGRFSEAKVDSFNFPFYLSTPQQLKGILGSNDSFTTERIEIILINPETHTMSDDVNGRASFYRAVLEGMLTDHFGSEVLIIDELFNLFRNKLVASPLLLNPDNDKNILLLAILKRKITD